MPETRVARGQARRATHATHNAAGRARASASGRAAGEIGAQRALGAQGDGAAVRLAYCDEEGVELVEEGGIGWEVDSMKARVVS